MSLLAPQCDIFMTLTPLPKLDSIADTHRKVLYKFVTNWTDSFWNTDVFVSLPPVPPDLTIWDMATEPTPQQLITQSAQPTADAITSTMTARTASISLPTYNWDSKDAYHFFSIFWCTLENWLLLHHKLTVRTTSDKSFATLGNQITGDACTVDAYWSWRGTTCNQGKGFCIPGQDTTGNDSWCQHPCVTRRTWGCSQAQRGPSRSCCMHQITDGLLQDDQWWAQRAWAAPMYCTCLSPWRKDPWQAYGQILQDTL